MKMRIAILQTDIRWNDAPANWRGAEALMDGCRGADLYVLPEMFTTGFCVRPEEVAEEYEGSPTVDWMRRQARSRGAAVAGSVAVRDGGGYHNRFLFVAPDGTVAAYDKRHLFGYGGEDKSYMPGGERVVVDYRGCRIMLQVCYDLRFPVWSRSRGDYDVLVYVANWPVPRAAVWSVLTRARAIENQCYVVAVNRVGRDPYCEYNGGSAVLDAYGRTVVQCADGVECAAVAEIDLERLVAFRRKFPVLKDADSFSVE